MAEDAPESVEHIWPSIDPEAASDAAETAPGAKDIRPRRGLLVGAALAGVIGLLYVLDLALGSGDVPRGVVVAGVDIGGLDPTAAEQRLRRTLAPRLAAPAQVLADGRTTTIDPAPAHIELDWAATLADAMKSSFNPWTRIKAYLVERPVDPVVRGDEGAISAALQPLSRMIDRSPQEGSIRFEETTPIPVEPVPGRKLELSGATHRVINRWAWGQPIQLAVAEMPVKATPDGVRTALERFARPAVARPVTMKAHREELTLSASAIAKALRFEANDDGGLTPAIAEHRLDAVLGKQLAKTETRAQDAKFVFGKKRARIKPSVDGREVDWGATAGKLISVLPLGERRLIDVPYVNTPARRTASDLSKLGIKEIIGQFTTSDFASDSGINIRTVAKKVHGAIIRPGETFSLNGFTGRRGTTQGYVAAAVIENGELSRAVGGGISQFATTLYNAAYFAAMVDVEHKEHSFYISRYPVAREATVFQNPDGSSAIDLRFRNDSKTGVAIQTIWTPSDITVRLWGTKRYKVESITGDKRNFTGIPVTVKPYGESCTPSSGAAGFTATDTRVIKDLKGKEISRKTRTVTYRPLSAVQCAPKPQPKPSTDPSKPKPSTKPSKPPARDNDANQPPLGEVVPPRR